MACGRKCKKYVDSFCLSSRRKKARSQFGKCQDHTFRINYPVLVDSQLIKTPRKEQTLLNELYIYLLLSLLFTFTDTKSRDGQLIMGFLKVQFVLGRSVYSKTQITK